MKLAADGNDRARRGGPHPAIHPAGARFVAGKPDAGATSARPTRAPSSVRNRTARSRASRHACSRGRAARVQCDERRGFDPHAADHDRARVSGRADRQIRSPERRSESWRARSPPQNTNDSAEPASMPNVSGRPAGARRRPRRRAACWSRSRRPARTLRRPAANSRRSPHAARCRAARRAAPRMSSASAARVRAARRRPARHATRRRRAGERDVDRRLRMRAR